MTPLSKGCEPMNCMDGERGRDRRIRIFDTTLRDGEQSPGASMSLKQKIRMAHVLEELGVDCIEAGFPISSPIQFNAVKVIADELSTIQVAALARCDRRDIDAAHEALLGARSPLLHLFIATSPLHRRHKLKMDTAQILEKLSTTLEYARKGFDLIEFSPEDATRTEPEFLAEIVKLALEKGAKIINIPDTVGYCVPWEMEKLVHDLHKGVLGLKDAVLSIHCHNDLGLAVANSLAAVSAGAGQVEVTLNGIGERAGNCSLEEIVMALKVRRSHYRIETGIHFPKLYPAARILQNVSGLIIPRNKPIFGENVFNHESGIHQHGVINHRETYEIINPEDIGRNRESLVLGRHSGRHAFRQRLQQYGVVLEGEAFENIFCRFLQLADQKKELGDDEILSLVSEALDLPHEAYRLDYYHIFTGNALIPGATVSLSNQQGVLKATASGDGPVEALFRSIDLALGVEAELDEYLVTAIGSGKDAQGRVLVYLRIDDIAVEGQASASDILKASALAYLNALNSYNRKKRQEQGEKR